MGAPGAAPQLWATALRGESSFKEKPSARLLNLKAELQTRTALPNIYLMTIQWQHGSSFTLLKILAFQPPPKHLCTEAETSDVPGV